MATRDRSPSGGAPPPHEASLQSVSQAQTAGADGNAEQGQDLDGADLTTKGAKPRTRTVSFSMAVPPAGQVMSGLGSHGIASHGTASQESNWNPKETMRTFQTRNDDEESDSDYSDDDDGTAAYPWMHNFQETPVSMIAPMCFCCMCSYVCLLSLLLIPGLGKVVLAIDMQAKIPITVADDTNPDPVNWHLGAMMEQTMHYLTTTRAGSEAILRDADQPPYDTRYDLKLVYQTTNGDNIMRSNYLEEIQRIEERILRASAEDMNGVPKSYADFCKQAKTSSSLRTLRWETADPVPECHEDPLLCCHYHLSAVGLFAKKWAPVHKTPEFAVNNEDLSFQHSGNFWINPDARTWQDMPCIMTDPETGGTLNVIEMGRWVQNKFTWERERLENWKQRYCGNIPNSRREPGFDCKCMALVYNSYMKDVEWDRSANLGWYRADSVDLTQENIDRVVQYWARYEDDEVARRKAVHASGWKNPEEAATSLGSEGGAEIWQATTPYVYGTQVPHYSARRGNSLRDCRPEYLFSRKCNVCRMTQWWNPLTWRGNTKNELGWQCVKQDNQNVLHYDGNGIPENSPALVPIKFPNIMAGVADLKFGACQASVDNGADFNVCVQRQEKATALRSVFKLQPEWKIDNIPRPPLQKLFNSERPDITMDEYVAEWAYTAYSDLLKELSLEARKKGLEVYWDGANIEGQPQDETEHTDLHTNSFEMSKRYVEKNMAPRIAIMLALSYLFILVFLGRMSGSYILAFLWLTTIFLSFGPMIFVYTEVFNIRNIGALHVIAPFIILAVGSDGFIVLMDAFDQTKREAQCSATPTKFKYTMSRAMHSVVASSFCVCATITVGFLAFKWCEMPALKYVAYLIALLVAVVWVANFTVLLGLVSIVEQVHELFSEEEIPQDNFLPQDHQSSYRSHDGAASSGTGASPRHQLETSSRKTTAIELGSASEDLASHQDSGTLGLMSAKSIKSVWHAHMAEGQQGANKKNPLEALDQSAAALLSADDLEDDEDYESEGPERFVELRPVEEFFAKRFFGEVYAMRYVLSILFLVLFVSTCNYIRPWAPTLEIETDMSQMFLNPDDSYSMLPTALAQHWGSSTVNPHKLRANIVTGPCYPCVHQGVKYNPMDVLYTRASKWADEGKQKEVQQEYQRRLVTLCEEMEALSKKSDDDMTAEEKGLRIAKEDKTTGKPQVQCPMLAFKGWLKGRREELRARSGVADGRYIFPSERFWKGDKAVINTNDQYEFSEFLFSQCDPKIQGCQTDMLYADLYSDQLRFGKYHNMFSIMLSVISIELDAVAQESAEDGMNLYNRWRNLADNFRDGYVYVTQRDMWDFSAEIDGVYVNFSAQALRLAAESSMMPEKGNLKLTWIDNQDTTQEKVLIPGETKVGIKTNNADGSGVHQLNGTYTMLLAPDQKDPFNLRGNPTPVKLAPEQVLDVIWVIKPTATPLDNAAFMVGDQYQDFLVRDEIKAYFKQGVLMMGLIISVLILLVLKNWVVALLAVLSIATIYLTTVTATSLLLGWKVGVIELFAYMLILAMSSESTIYLSDAFLQAPSKMRKERAQYMVTKVGNSMLSTTVSTMGVAVLMIATDVMYISKIGFAILLVQAISFLVAVVMYTALLALVGPEGEFGNFDYMFCCKNIQEEYAATGQQMSLSHRPTLASMTSMNIAASQAPEADLVNFALYKPVTTEGLDQSATNTDLSLLNDGYAYAHQWQTSAKSGSIIIDLAQPHLITKVRIYWCGLWGGGCSSYAVWTKVQQKDQKKLAFETKDAPEWTDRQDELDLVELNAVCKVRFVILELRKRSQDGYSVYQIEVLGPQSGELKPENSVMGSKSIRATRSTRGGGVGAMKSTRTSKRRPAKKEEGMNFQPSASRARSNSRTRGRMTSTGTASQASASHPVHKESSQGGDVLRSRSPPPKAEGKEI